MPDLRSRNLWTREFHSLFFFLFQHLHLLSPQPFLLSRIFVKSVKDRGPAVLAGLNIGDRLVSVNGETVAGRTYAQVVQMIQKSRDSLFLVVVPRQDDILQVVSIIPGMSLY